MDKNTITDHFSSDYEQFYSRFLRKILRRKGEERFAICPFHDDHEPSFSFNKKTGLFQCFGCGASGSIFEFFALKRGVYPRCDLPKEISDSAYEFHNTHQNAKKNTTTPAVRPVVIARYDYQDETGMLLYQIERLDPKSFRIRRPDGKGGWIYSRGDVRIVLYNLPEVLKADEILIVEGEKDCNSLHDLGFVATTAPFGAGKFLETFSPYFNGKNVVLLPDNDEPGRKHAEDVRQILAGYAKSIRWLDLPGLPNKGDVSDFLSTFQDKTEAAERLSLLIEGAPEYGPVQDADPTPGKSILKPFSLPEDALLSLAIPERKRHLGPICSGSLGMIHAPRGIGKTMFCLSLSLAITRGLHFGNWKTGEPGSVCYVDGEMPLDRMQERLGRFVVRSMNSKAPLVFLSNEFLFNQGQPSINLMDEQCRKNLFDFLTNEKFSVVFLDNLSALTPSAKENDRDDVFTQWLLSLRFAGIAVIFVHHSGKNGDQRGTSAREDALDWVAKMSLPPGYSATDGCAADVSFTKARSFAGQEAEPFRFEILEQEDGGLTWATTITRETNRALIIAMLGNLFKQKEISELLRLDKGYVSRVKHAAIKEKILNEDGTFTDTGKISYGNIDLSGFG